MRRLQNTNIDRVVCGRERADEVLADAVLLIPDERQGSSERLTSMRSDHRSGKSALAMSDIDSAICARIALSLGVESWIMAATSAFLSAVLSASVTGASS